MIKHKAHLVQKLHPNRFPNMSSKMVALVGWILGEEFTTPGIKELHITHDGYLMARCDNDVGFNHFIGTAKEFQNNVYRLLDSVPELTNEEKMWIRLRILSI